MLRLFFFNLTDETNGKRIDREGKGGVSLGIPESILELQIRLHIII